MAKEKSGDQSPEEPAVELTAEQREDAIRRVNFRRFDVSLLNGSRLSRVTIPRIPARVERQKMSRLDDKGKQVTEIVEVPVDVDAEMAADAIRAYNGTGPEATNYTAKQLVVAAVD